MASVDGQQPSETTAIKHSFSQDDFPVIPPPSAAKNIFDRIPKRYLLAFMAFLGFCNVYALRVNLSVAIVAMVANRTVMINGTETMISDFHWSPETRGIVLGSFFYGYIVTQLPGGWLGSRFGGKFLFGGGILCTAVLTIMTPPAARVSEYLLIVLRVFEGLCEGVTFPCMHALWSRWAPPLERSKLATIAFSGSYVGTVISMPLSGVIAKSLGWPWIFYIFGIFAIVWFIFWCWLVTECPADHPTITTYELEYIQRSIGFSFSATQGEPTPWKDMALSLPVWAIIVAHFAENWGFYTLLTELPTFLNDVMGYDLYKAGFVAAIPYLVMAIMVQVGGQLADLFRVKKWLSTTNTRKLFNCGAFVSQSVFMVVTAYTMTPVAAVTCLTLAVGFGGFAWSGFSVNHLDIAPQFAGILMGISNTFGTIPGIMSPTLTGHIVQKRSPDEWRVIFYLAAGIYTAGAVFYLLFASGRLQPWAEIQTSYSTHYDYHDHHSQQDQVEDDKEDDKEEEIK